MPLHRLTPVGNQKERLIVNTGLTHYHVQGHIRVIRRSFDDEKITVYVWATDDVVEDVVREHVMKISPAYWMAVPVGQVEVETIKLDESAE